MARFIHACITLTRSRLNNLQAVVAASIQEVPSHYISSAAVEI